ncbi:MAG TPA: hypothetical protein PLW09_16555 [Candidatus Kapabacteria bacterium]|nr:hypothetical protein [Candidatus Kapabacteria bacterium]
MKKMLVLSAFICLQSFFIGCKAIIGEFSAISTKKVDIGMKYVKTQTIETKQSMWFVFGFPLDKMTLMTVVSQCLEEGGGEYATDVTITSETLPLVLVSHLTYSIKADVWKRASSSDILLKKQDIYELKIMDDGKKYMVATHNTENVIPIFQ